MASCSGPVSEGNRTLARPLNPKSINTLMQTALARAGVDPPPHSLRAGFVTRNSQDLWIGVSCDLLITSL
jgi:hypothetical protein